ncbi:MAG: CBS domain-containing protein [Polyangiaceae bacterium]|nr:CBS domain-containing protein [Polyangiaceae bacterium]
MPHRRIPQLKDVMTPFPHFVGAEQSVSSAREQMVAHGVRHLPVKDGGELCGIVSERDLAVAASSAVDLPLRELCDKDLYVVDLHTRLEEVVVEMAKRRVGSALVVRDGRLAGILTATDVCRLYGELLTLLAPPVDEPA